MLQYDDVQTLDIDGVNYNQEMLGAQLVILQYLWSRGVLTFELEMQQFTVALYFR